MMMTIRKRPRVQFMTTVLIWVKFKKCMHFEIDLCERAEQALKIYIVQFQFLTKVFFSGNEGDSCISELSSSDPESSEGKSIWGNSIFY